MGNARGKCEVACVRGEVVSTAVEPEDDFFGGGVADPKGFVSVREGDVSGFEALFLGVGEVGFVESGGDSSRVLPSA